ncbi:UPF0481 protein At3g47200-like [Malania oleifera]|uniref:UPF0481 protein At3g47200-like n=1 Tax=Malania oleifera TaxID=397392 RepID=UPI0025ADB59C|nr:UPF0481 protein At3g47200-like [Malania oleifera]XP_057958704.1 UPF0481 protein At3g47200-like [Malania oleifera]XP_057958705.1 UPF0481 protein At3g47200-like [Malania oleifera]
MENSARQDVKIEHLTLSNSSMLPRDQVVISIQGLLRELHPLSNEYCIYRVPEAIRKVNGEAYTPKVASIGPLHRCNARLQTMEEHKLRYLEIFILRTSVGVEGCVQVARNCEGRARRCYAEAIKLSSDEFVEMILVDGCFIIEFLLRYYFLLSAFSMRDQSDYIFGQSWFFCYVADDLLLLENQLPLFVLEDLFSLVSINNITNDIESEGKTLSIVDLALHFVKKKSCWILNYHQTPDSNKIYLGKAKHLVDLLWLHCKPSLPRNNRNCEVGLGAATKHSTSATRLLEAGIKFKKGESCSIFDIKYLSGGVVEIPLLRIQDGTEFMFRNLIAYEQCQGKYDYITEYMTLLVDIINTTKDVELLVRQGIIANAVGNSQDISTLFSSIGTGIIIGHRIYYSQLCENLNAYCRTPWHSWKATLQRDYFNTPWTVFSTIAALALVILAFIQTLCSIISLPK